MWKLVYKQLWSRRRNNTSILLELLLAFCLVWYMVDFFFVLIYNYNLPNSRDINHTWQVSIQQYSEGQTPYNPSESDPEIVESNYHRILNRIKDYPGVLDVAVSFYSSTPAHGGYQSITYRNSLDTLSSISCQRIVIEPNANFFKVFNYVAGDGKTKIADMDINWSESNGVIIGEMVEENLFPDQSAVGKFIETMDGERQVRVLGVVGDVKRFNHMRPHATYYDFEKISAENIPYASISIRTHPDISPKLFASDFKKNMENELQIGNFYLEDIRSFDRIHELIDQEFGLKNEIQVRIYLMSFFLINILLCVIGTFWYRVNSRKNESGLRLALGSTRLNIKNLFYMEGLALLSIIILPAVLVEFQLVNAGILETLGGYNKIKIYLPDRLIPRFLITNSITLVIVVFAIFLGIWFPAHKASVMEPAEALRYE